MLLGANAIRPDGDFEILSKHPSLPVLTPHHHEHVIVQAQVSVLVTEMVTCAILGGVQAGHVFEIEAFGRQFFQWYTGLTILVSVEDVFQNAAVLPQRVVDVSDRAVGIGIPAVIPGISAGVAAKALVHPPKEFISAFRAFSGFHVQCKTFVLA